MGQKHGSEWTIKEVREGGVKAGEGWLGPKSDTRGGRRVDSPCGAERGALDFGQFELGQQRVGPRFGVRKVWARRVAPPEGWSP